MDPESQPNTPSSPLCEDPSVIPEAVPLFSPSDSMSEEDEGVIPGPWEVLVAHKTCARSYLDRYISDGIVAVFENAVDDEGPSTFSQDYPSLDPGGGGSSHLLPWSHVYEAYGADFQVRWG